MVRAMPVISITSPRNTNIGTASKIKWDTPSSMRPTTTPNGIEVDSERYEKVANPKANAIGIPNKTADPTTPIKKITRFALPKSDNTGPMLCNAIASTTAINAADSVSRTPRIMSLTNAIAIIKQVATGIAAARQPSEIDRPGNSIGSCCIK